MGYISYTELMLACSKLNRWSQEEVNSLPKGRFGDVLKQHYNQAPRNALPRAIAIVFSPTQGDSNARNIVTVPAMLAGTGGGEYSQQ
jgi:hypothetical protein